MFPRGEERGHTGPDLMDDDTIAAIATPLGAGGIGIVRISGEDAAEIVSRLFRPTSGTKRFRSHLLYHGHILDPESGEVVDEVLCVVMRAPKSYTREDIAEIHCHGGAAVVGKILELVLRQGARLAEPGEFTKRAFLNGRIDLIEAEAVLDLATARSASQHRAGLSLLSGLLGERIRTVRAALLAELAAIEAAIDYPDEAPETASRPEVAQRLEEDILFPSRALIEAYRQGHVAREGARVVLAGHPNVGKSSLFNAMIGFERVIVSAVPGTTRDRVEETVEMDGLPVILVDTAGLREDTEEIEHKGIQMAWEQLEMADLVLFVADASTPPVQEERAILDTLEEKGKRVVVALNKCDSLDSEIAASWERSHPGIVKISCKTGEGLDSLRKTIVGTLLKEKEPPAVIPTLRQKRLLQEAEERVQGALEALRSGHPEEVAALEIRSALEKLDAVTGNSFDADLLDTMFSSFCLGK